MLFFRWTRSIGTTEIMSDVFGKVPMNALKVFLVASNSRTFTAAAEELGVTQAAVSRQIALIEETLSMQLFSRGARKLTLTDDGRVLANRLGPHYFSLTDELCEILERRRTKTVKLRVYPTVADRWLLPLIGQFEEQHPDIALQFDTTVEPLDFRSTGIDVAIQLGTGDWSGAKSRFLFPGTFEPVCSPDYFARFDRDPQQLLTRGRRLTSRYRRRDWSIWEDATGNRFESDARLLFQSSLLTYNGAILGLGVALGQKVLLGSDFRTGKLICPFDSPVEPAQAFYAVWSSHHALPPHAKRFVDWLLNQCGETTHFNRTGS